MVAVISFFDPTLREASGELEIFGGLALVAAKLAQFDERAEGADGLRAQVDVVSEVTGEIVGAKLVLRVKTLRLEILYPALELLPVKPGEIGVAFHLRDGAEQQQQIATLLDRHLVFLGAFATAINLAVCLGISAEVMRRERELPTFACRIVHEWHQERLRQRRSKQQELRCHRIKRVAGADAAV